MNFKLEMMVFETLVIPTLLDGCELWGAMNKLSYEQEKLFAKIPLHTRNLGQQQQSHLSLLLALTHSFPTNSILQTMKLVPYIYPLGPSPPLRKLHRIE